MRAQLRSRRLLVAREPDSGMALVVVLAVTTVLTLLLVATTSFAMNQLRQGRTDQDWQAALAAAEGGVDQYLAHLNNDSSYYRWGNPTSPYSTGSNVTLPTGSAANPAFTGWDPLPGVTNSYFRYDVNTSSYFTTGIIKLRSSGKVGKRIRTVEVQLKRYSFGDYLYFTNYEEKDPATYSIPGDSYTPAQAQANCGNKHYYEGRIDAVNGTKVGCTIISFGTGDQLNGPVRSNDAIYACGTAFFNGAVTSSYNPSAGNHWLSCGGGKPTFVYANDPRYAPPLVLPSSDAAMKLQTDPRYTDPVGCLYSGPTQIVLNANGTMNVTSPWTINGGPAYCGVGNNIPLPVNGVVYVENVPIPADAYTRSTPPTTGSCSNDYGLGYPIASDITTYNCNSGDIFVEGTLSGQLSLAAENNIIITWNITYAGGASGNDILGMVANNWVQIYHPVKTVGNSGNYQELGITNNGHGGAAFKNPTVWGAILALQHSFMLQNWDKGSFLGNSNVNGAMGQNYRGVMGITGQSGTTKNYTYDSRLNYASPPHFINPVQSSFGSALWSEITPAYAS